MLERDLMGRKPSTAKVRQGLLAKPLRYSGVTHIFQYTAAGISQGVVLVDGTRGLITLVAYLLVFFVIGLAVFRRRDVTA